MRVRKLNSTFLDLLPRLRTLDWRDGAERAESILADVRGLIEHGEPGVALENLCENLYEYSVPISQQELDELEALAKAMRMPDGTWECLREIAT